MPLRDHFRPPLADRRRWDAFLGQWPAMIVIGLNRLLPDRYFAGPHIHLGSVVTTDPPGQDTYEVRVYDTEAGERPVAAVEIVSPANKDRPEHRRAFIAKCAALLQEGVCVAIVDLVTTRTSNLYRELMEFLGQPDCAFPDDAPSLYAVALRWSNKADRWILETWVNPLALGRPLPTLPLWLAEDFAIPLELEPSYEETCRILRLPSV
jgi:hypothetical protein